ncbi:MAG: helix-turn-helix domain-containing protein, partial [Pseudonocardia sp.]
RAADTNSLLAVVVRGLVDEIVAALRERATGRERRLLAAFLDAKRRTSGAVAVVGEGLVIANPQAVDLGLDRADLWDEVRSSSLDGARVALPADLTARVRLLDDDGRAAGAVVTLDEPPAPRRPTAMPGDPWAAAVRRAGVIAAHGPVAVSGEAGAGKRTVLRAALGEQVPVLDAATYTADGAASWIARLREHLGGALIVRHVELLDIAAARAVSAVLDGATGPVGLTVTVPDGAPPGPAAALLLDELSAGTVTLPPLRHDPDAVVTFAQAELRRSRDGWSFAADAVAGLRRHHWPGNLAELVRVVRDAARDAEGPTVGLDVLPAQIRHATERRALTPLERAELSVISAVLRAHCGNKSTAARELGISRTALYAKIRTYRI